MSHEIECQHNFNVIHSSNSIFDIASNQDVHILFLDKSKVTHFFISILAKASYHSFQIFLFPDKSNITHSSNFILEIASAQSFHMSLWDKSKVTHFFISILAKASYHSFQIFLFSDKSNIIHSSNFILEIASAQSFHMSLLDKSKVTHFFISILAKASYHSFQIFSLRLNDNSTHSFNLKFLAIAFTQSSQIQLPNKYNQHHSFSSILEIACAQSSHIP
jgi:hypothetical protein